MKKSIIIFLFISFSQIIYSQGKLAISIKGLKNTTGPFYISLFSSEDGFPDNREKAHRKVRINGLRDLSVEYIFSNLNEGDYALAYFQDENGDGKLNVNKLGIPTEGYGFSGNGNKIMGLAKFKDCVFHFTGLSGTELMNSLSIKYLFSSDKPKSPEK